MSQQQLSDHFELSLPSELGYEVIARNAIATFARCVGFDSNRIDDLKTAVSEACINGIEHGNQLREDVRLDIVCSYSSERLQVEVYDQGIEQFALVSQPLSIEQKVAGMGPLRGMGLMLMAQLADEADFVTNDHDGNCFRLTWHTQADTLHPEPAC